MLLQQGAGELRPATPAAAAPTASARWITRQPGLRQLVTPRGPWLQVFNANGFEWNIYEVVIPHLPAGLEGLRILQVADLHCWKHWDGAYDELIDQVRANKPDLMLFTGDMVEHTRRPLPELPIARRLVKSLSARLGMYWIRGNHDARLSRHSFNGTPVHNVEGDRLLIETGGGPVELIGLPGPQREDLTDEFVRSIPQKQTGVPRIVMSHYPDHMRKIEPRGTTILPDVYLAGHTHGGQVCLPGGFAPIRHDSLPQSLCRGVHRWAHGWFVVSRGLGFSSYRFRVLCPAEVIELRLVGNSECRMQYAE